MPQLQNFIDFLIQHDSEPAFYGDIIPDDVQRYYDLKGDKKGRKRASYALKIDDDCAVGWCYNHKDQEKYSYFTINNEDKLNQDQINGIRKKIKEHQEQQKLEEKKIKIKAARLARKIYENGEDAKFHPYISNKTIKPYYIKQGDAEINGKKYNNALLIPMRKKKSILSLQLIMEDGYKLFLKDGVKKGCYHEISQEGDSYENIIICEGYATGASLYEATKIPVFCAFDSGNLLHASRNIMKIHEGVPVIFAADNDQWRKDNKGKLSNIGLNKAKEAAKIFPKSIVIKPTFDNEDAEKRTDFNDLHQEKGLDVVKNIVLGALSTIGGGGGIQQTPPLVGVQPPAPPPSIIKDLPPVDSYSIEEFKPRKKEAWEDLTKTKTNSAGTMLDLDSSYSINYALHVANNPLFKGIFCFDEFANAIMVVRCPPWDKPERFKVRELSDNDIIQCDYTLQTMEYPLKGNKANTTDAIVSAANLNKINPARDYFDSLTWDGVCRLDSWLVDYCGAIFDDEEYLRAVGAKWMMAAVARVYEPGCQFDHMIIFEGGQGVYKSSLLRSLATFGINNDKIQYFTDSFSIKKCRETNELLKLSGCLIVEICEMSGFTEASIDDVKWFVAAREDRFKQPYARTAGTYKRSFVLAGSYNPSEGIFTDSTGNRRFWPVKIKAIDMEAIERDKEMLWAEAKYRYQDGEPTYLDQRMMIKAEMVVKTRSAEDAWDHAILKITENINVTSIPQILTELGIPMGQQDQKMQRRIGKVLTRFGFERGQKVVAGKRLSIYKRKIKADLTGVGGVSHVTDEEMYDL